MTTTEGRAHGRQVRHRVCARVLPVNPKGEVLLLHGWDPAAPDEPYWFSIGGAIDADESLVDAAVREMREETGIVIQPTELSEAIAREDTEFDWGAWRLVQDQTFFALALAHDPASVSFEGLEPIERTTIDAAAWWTPDALEADGSAANAQLPEIMRTAVRTIRGMP
ncbi:MAG TPA: NUDIX domain-containing protein [Nocardioides sp.]|nr:NUDIX domain-containing protein [Nocardioides sp.]